MRRDRTRRPHRHRSVLRTVHLVVAACAASVLCAGCMALGAAPEADYKAGAAVEYREEARAQAPPAPAQSDNAALAVATAGDIPTEDPAASRLRVFSADLAMVVVSVDRARQATIALAEAAEGYVESSSEDFLVIRVPAASFDRVLEAITELGDVESKAVRAADVTDQYADLERRRSIAQTTRERLYQLLEVSEDPEERVRVVEEIRRLTQEIEELTTALESLDRLVKYSRISVRLIPRIVEARATREAIPFDWIAELEPLSESRDRLQPPILPELPDDFAVFETGARVRAESAEGTRLRIGSARNVPRGDTTFWDVAVRFHLSPLYRDAEPLRAGGFRGTLFTSKDPEPFFYVVAVLVRGREIVVAEAFFPDADERDKRLPQVTGTLEGVAQ